MRYPIVLHNDDGARWGVTVPDLPGCFSAGDSVDEALERVVEAIGLHLEGVIEDGGEVPVPRPVSAHFENPDFAGGTWALAEVNTGKFDGWAEEINITIPHRVLARVDAYVKAHGLTRSGFLVQAAERAIR
ncbi:type II toxin-antitoxin system HicB family antitoxin [Verminephrobacter aporrectodeae subsp. tuberculatae]|uniref:type II toxin-antitoxin system HicB family antitoxin n=1 Tax=Verminephrobacter aporrectodeae TaxID=1110389 RepID=UPI0022447526|nr:type II toxin-antitoxin system HicB family antitoxin [Verminephrobacter aporrectodeae]MCW8166700.1 type II toxin-antitoxin system HicB family antitoxin [Verminephrobacter aporrectodeae subsp. tuberculatae]MCW8170492.1 type II toxin-antitoxin system HicB family antitoxin [Verminephrobacter aporrectodeae subsp. tuberculatae]